MGFPLSRRPGRVYLWNRPREDVAPPAPERIVAPRVRPVAAVRWPPPAGRVYLAPLARPPVTERPQPLRAPRGVAVPAAVVRRARVYGSGWLGRTPVTERTVGLRPVVGQHPVPAPGRVHGRAWDIKTPVAERSVLGQPVAPRHPAPPAGRVYGRLWDIKTPVAERPQPLHQPVAAKIPVEAVAFPQVYGRLWKLREPVDSRTWPVRPVRVEGLPPPLLGRAQALGLSWRHEEEPTAPTVEPTKGRRPRRIALTRPVELKLDDRMLIPVIGDRWREGVVPMAEPGVLRYSLTLAQRRRSPVTAWAADLGAVEVAVHAGGRARGCSPPRAARIWEDEDALLLGLEPTLE